MTKGNKGSKSHKKGTAVDRILRTTKNRDRFKAKAAVAKLSQSPPAALYSASWTSLQLLAFVREYMPDAVVGFKKIRDRHDKMRVIDDHLRQHRHEFSAFANSKELAAAVVKIAEDQEADMERLWRKQRRGPGGDKTQRCNQDDALTDLEEDSDNPQGNLGPALLSGQYGSEEEPDQPTTLEERPKGLGSKTRTKAIAFFQQTNAQPEHSQPGSDAEHVGAMKSARGYNPFKASSERAAEACKLGEQTRRENAAGVQSVNHGPDHSQIPQEDEDAAQWENTTLRQENVHALMHSAAYSFVGPGQKAGAGRPPLRPQQEPVSTAPGATSISRIDTAAQSNGRLASAQCVPESRGLSMAELCAVKIPGTAALAPNAVDDIQYKSGPLITNVIVSSYHKIFHADDLAAFSELLEDMDSFHWDDEMPEAEMFWKRLYLPMVLSKGSVYDKLDSEGCVQTIEPGKGKRSGPVYVAARLGISDKAPADPRLPAGVLVFEHKTGAKASASVKTSDNVFILNAIALSDRIQPEDRARVRVALWDKSHLADINSLRASISKGMVQYILAQPAWPGYPRWQLDTGDAEDGVMHNPRRIKATGTPWFVPSYDREGGTSAAAPKKAEFAQIRPGAGLDLHAHPLKVELNARTPLVTALLATVAQTLKQVKDGVLKADTLAAELITILKSPKPLALAVLDMQAGAPRHRLAIASGAAAKMSGVHVGVVNVDAMPMLFSINPHGSMPADYNALNPAEFAKAPRCIEFFKSLRLTAEYSPNSTVMLGALSMPVVVSMSISRAQIRSWAEAVDKAQMVVAIELVSPIHDTPSLRNFTEVGVPIQIPQSAGVQWGVEAFMETDMQITVFVRNSIWALMQQAGTPPKAGGYRKLIGAYSYADSVVANIPACAVLELGSGDKPSTPKRSADQLRPVAQSVNRAATDVSRQVECEDFEMANNASREELECILCKLTFEPDSIEHADPDLILNMWRRLLEAGLGDRAAADAVVKSLSARAHMPSARAAMTHLGIRFEVSSMQLFTERVAASSDVTQLNELWGHLSAIPDQAAGRLMIARRLQALKAVTSPESGSLGYEHPGVAGIRHTMQVQSHGGGGYAYRGDGMGTATGVVSGHVSSPSFESAVLTSAQHNAGRAAGLMDALFSQQPQRPSCSGGWPAGHSLDAGIVQGRLVQPSMLRPAGRGLEVRTGEDGGSLNDVHQGENHTLGALSGSGASRFGNPSSGKNQDVTDTVGVISDGRVAGCVVDVGCVVMCGDDQRLGILEVRLEELWELGKATCLSGSVSQGQQRLHVASYQMLLPLLTHFGCVEGSEMDEWVHELGKLRQTRCVKHAFLSFPVCGVEHIARAAIQHGWRVTLSDGSARDVGKSQHAMRNLQNRKAGAAAYDLQSPEDVTVMKTVGRVQTNSRAEYEAGLLAWMHGKLSENVLNLSDSEDFVKLADMEVAQFAENVLRRGKLRNAFPAVMCKLVQHIASGRRQAINIRAHCGCAQQDLVDEAAKMACELPVIEWRGPDIKLDACCKVMCQWSVEGPAQTKLHRVPISTLMSGTWFRVDVEKLWEGGRDAALRDAMRERTHEAAVKLVAIIDMHRRITVKLGLEQAVRRTAANAAVVENRWREMLVASTQDLTGSRKIGAPRIGKHTATYSEAQEEIADMAISLDEFSALLEEVKPETLEDWMARDPDVLYAMTAAGGVFARHPGANAEEVALSFVQFLGMKRIGKRQRRYGALRQIIARVHSKLEQAALAIEDVAEADLHEQKFAAVHGIWVRKGQSKMLGRAMSAAVASNEFKFGIDALEFVKAVAHKATVTGAQYDCDRYETWTECTMKVSEASFAAFGAPWSAHQVACEIAKTSKGKAFSRVSQISKDMFKVISMQNPGARVLIDKIEAFDCELQSEAAFQHLVEALEACCGAEDSHEGVQSGLPAFIAALFNIMEITGVANPPWLRILLSPLFKNKIPPGVKLSPAEIEHINGDLGHWREVAQADAFRTLYGSCVSTEWIRFSRANNLHKEMQLAYLPGVDAMALHHLRFDIIQILSIAGQMPWSATPLVLVVVAADLKHYFSTFTDKSREDIMNENCFPEIRRNGQRAIHNGMTVAMINDGKLTDEIPIGCELMGSAEACMFATAAHSGLNHKLEAGGRGFSFPTADAWGSSEPPVTHLPAMEQCDDFTLFSGGVGKSPGQSMQDMQWQVRLTAGWAVKRGFYFSVDSADASKSKCVAFGYAIDQYGCRQKLEPVVFLPTEVGMVQLPLLGEGDAFKMLGVWRAAKEDVQIAANVDMCVQKTLDKLAVVLNDKFPVMAQIQYARNSVTGGFRWAADKTRIPWSTVVATSKLEAAEAKTFLGLGPGTLTAYLYALTADGGCGLTSSEHMVVVQGVGSFMSMLNSKNLYVRTMMRYAVGISRVVNAVDNSDNSTFFSWDVARISMKQLDQMKAPAVVVTALRAALLHGVGFIFDADADCVRFKHQWKDMLYLTDSAEIAKEVMNDIYHSRWREQLLAASIDSAAVESSCRRQRELANLWRADRSIPNGVVRTAVKAAIDAVPVGLNLFKWGISRSPACHCGAECASMMHISQKCHAVHGLITKRSQLLVELCLDSISASGSSAWSFVGEAGCHPPAFLLPPDWRDKLVSVASESEGTLKWTQHRLPDIVLVNASAGSKMTVVIADPTVCWRDLSAAGLRKVQSYTPLKELIEMHLGDRCDKVLVVPIPFTARGTPPADWVGICASLKIKIPSTVLLKRIQKMLLQQLDAIVKMWQLQHLQFESI